MKIWMTIPYKHLLCFRRGSRSTGMNMCDPSLLCTQWRHWSNKHQLLPYLLQQSKEHICMYGPLMGFIQHDNGILGQIRIYEALPQQHPICHVFDDSLGAGAVFKSNGVANLDRGVEQKLRLQN